MSKGLTEGDEGFPWDRHVGRTVAVLCVVGRCALRLGMIVSEERDEWSRRRHPERFARNLNVDSYSERWRMSAATRRDSSE